MGDTMLGCTMASQSVRGWLISGQLFHLLMKSRLENGKWLGDGWLTNAFGQPILMGSLAAIQATSCQWWFID